MASKTLSDSPFLKACRREPTDYVPVWLMRQAGRYMKDYRVIREQNSFLELCKNTDLVTEVTVGAQEKIGADAAIIFADILLLVEAFGLGLDYVKGDGPQIHRPIRSLQDVKRLPSLDIESDLSYVFESIKKTRRALQPDIPLIGFAGAPFTLASYMIEGGSSRVFKRTKALMRSKDQAWHKLMLKLCTATTEYLNLQVKAGAQALQLFDSWAGYLTPAEYEKFALLYSKKIISGLDKKVPVIYFGTRTKRLLPFIAKTGASVVGISSDITLDKAWKIVGYNKAIQGNLDPQVLFSSLGEIKKQVTLLLRQAVGRPGYIFNLGHGVLPQTPEKNVIALIKMVHELSRK